jgi:aspartate/methionine/tyrosine aminotransferase
VFQRPQRSAFHLGPEFVTTNSLTKVYGMSGLRCGWILAEPELARRMWLLDDLFDVNPAYTAELLSCIALANLDRARAKSQALLETNRKALNAFLAARADLDVKPLEFGTVAFPRLLTGPVDDFCGLLRDKYETSVAPGRFFEMPDRFRIGISGEPDLLPEALHRLGAALDEFQSR